MTDMYSKKSDDELRRDIETYEDQAARCYTEAREYEEWAVDAKAELERREIEAYWLAHPESEDAR